MGHAGSSDGCVRRGRLQRWWPHEAWLAPVSFDDQLLRSDGLGGGVLR
ncbi:uncharacterized protein LOC100276164 [Zea mays]|nr:uncharacterized protein LOC100276164 [Zea mays]